MSKVVLAIRTDTTQASVVLFSPLSSLIGRSLSSAQDRGSSQSNEVKIIDQITWTAGRQLSATLLTQIDELLKKNQTTWSNIAGIIVYEGPGSFTGLRIGITVANTAAFVLNVPIVGASGEDWLEQGIGQLKTDRFTGIVMPFYGAEANITKPKG